MMAADAYKVLGVDRNASDKEIKAAYKRLAMKHHPDRNPGSRRAEERFKDVSQAFEILGDKEKRRLYDEFGEDSLRTGFDPERARAYGQWAKDGGFSWQAAPGSGFGGGFGGFGGDDAGGFEDILGSLFGKARRRASRA